VHLTQAFNATRRLWLRSQLRRLWLAADRRCDAAIAKALQLEATEVSKLLRSDYFGAAWAKVQRVSPALEKQRVAVADLANQAERASSILQMLRSDRRSRPALANPADTQVLGDAP
jgi:hypothetical protein